MVEVKKTKKEFNTRERELLNDGYKKCGESHNQRKYRKHISMYEDSIILLVQGWKTV